MAGQLALGGVAVLTVAACQSEGATQSGAAAQGPASAAAEQAPAQTAPEGQDVGVRVQAAWALN